MTKEKVARTAAQTAVLMAILTLGSKLLGFVREMVMAGFFGTSYIVDAYVMAQSIPNILFTGIFIAIATAYIPLLSDKIENEGDLAGNIFTSQVIKILFVVSIISSVLGLFFSNGFVTVFASGFTGETAKLTGHFLKVTFSYVIFISIAGILESFLQYKNTFLPQIIVGYTQNFIVIGTIIISALSSYYLLAFGLLAAYFVRLILFYMLAKKRNFRFVYKKGNELKIIVKKITMLAIPVFIGSSLSQINLFVDKSLASRLPEGSISALNYANLLNNMIMTLTVTIFTTIVYPKLAQANSLGDRIKFNQMATTGIILIVLLALPCSLGAMLYNNEVVQIVYERGAFDEIATSLTSSAYVFYSAGLLFMSLNVLLLRIYYSLHNTKTPMIFAGISVIINIVFNLLLIRSMAHAGLALATSISSCSNTIMLLWGIKRNYKDIDLLPNISKLLKIIICTIVSLGISFCSYLIITQYLVDIIYMRIVQLAIVVVIAAIVYIILLHIFKIDEVKMIKQLIKR